MNSFLAAVWWRLPKNPEDISDFLHCYKIIFGLFSKVPQNNPQMSHIHKINSFSHSLSKLLKKYKINFKHSVCDVLLILLHVCFFNKSYWRDKRVYGIEPLHPFRQQCHLASSPVPSSLGLFHKHVHLFYLSVHIAWALGTVCGKCWMHVCLMLFPEHLQHQHHITHSTSPTTTAHARIYSRMDEWYI